MERWLVQGTTDIDAEVLSWDGAELLAYGQGERLVVGVGWALARLGRPEGTSRPIAPQSGPNLGPTVERAGDDQPDPAIDDLLRGVGHYLAIDRL